MHRLSLPSSADGATLRFDALPDFACTITLETGQSTVRLDRVPMLIGMAPFTGISVGIDGGGPVDWDLHERRGPFPQDGFVRHVRYVPGPKAPYNPEKIVAIDAVSARLMD